MKRVLRAVTRPLKRLIRPLRLAHIDYLRKHSAHQLERLCDLRDSLMHMERYEHLRQVELEMRRNRIERGRA